MDRPDPLTPIEVFEAIQRILRRTDSISLTEHCRERASERRFAIDDIRRVLAQGTVSSKAIWKDKYEEWNYTISGTDFDLEPLVLVIAIEERFDRITIITGRGD